MSQRTDEEIVRDIQEGDIYAFETLVRKYQRKLFGFVHSFVADRDLCEDVVQESFLNFYTRIRNVDTGRKVSSYLFAVARNEALSALRGKKRHIPLEEANEVPDATDIEADLIRRERSTQVRHAVSKLDTKYRQVLSLYYYDDMSYQEISKRLRLPVNTIRTHLKRAKTALGRLLTNENA